MLTVVLAATFTADPVATACERALREHGIPARVTLAPYAQVVETLADSGSVAFDARTDALLVLARPEDALRSDRAGASQYAGTCPGRADDWCAALEAAFAAARGQAKTWLCLAPAPPRLSPEAAAWGRGRRAALEAAARAAGTTLISAPDAREEDDDPFLDALAHAPYRAAFADTLGQACARALHAWAQPPLKALAVDCDDTLWGGAVGELGPEHVVLSEAHLGLQRFLVREHDAGRFICLVSHNIPDDVFAVLDRSDAVLRREHVAAHRIGWRPKPALVDELAAELALGTDAFAFVDAEPLEQALMRAARPPVRVVDLPADPARFVAALGACWWFDFGAVTDADRARARRHREERSRRLLAAGSASHEEFVRTLRVEVRIEPLTDDNAERAEQLSVRTNQFTTTARRFRAAELLRLREHAGADIVLLDVADRLGDYGLTGLAITRAVGTELVVDALMLSCRILGRGVEDALAGYLAELAARRSCDTVSFRIDTTARNEPARAFVAALTAGRADGRVAPSELTRRALTGRGYEPYARARE